MSDETRRKMPDPPTTVRLDMARGNELFERSIAAVGLEETTSRWLMASVLKSIAVSPLELTPEDLGILLPEADRRLRQLVQPEQADQAMSRLYKMLMAWQGTG
jgi:hypothetical protein